MAHRLTHPFAAALVAVATTGCDDVRDMIKHVLGGPYELVRDAPDTVKVGEKYDYQLKVLPKLPKGAKFRHCYNVDGIAKHGVSEKGQVVMHVTRKEDFEMCVDLEGGGFDERYKWKVEVTGDDPKALAEKNVKAWRKQIERGLEVAKDVEGHPGAGCADVDGGVRQVYDTSIVEVLAGAEAKPPFSFWLDDRFAAAVKLERGGKIADHEYAKVIALHRAAYAIYVITSTMKMPSREKGQKAVADDGELVDSFHAGGFVGDAALVDLEEAKVLCRVPLVFSSSREFVRKVTIYPNDLSEKTPLYLVDFCDNGAAALKKAFQKAAPKVQLTGTPTYAE